MQDRFSRAGTVEELMDEWRFAAGLAAHRKSLSIVAVGAHPDDPETGCGGALALAAKLGHNVHILYLTRGEAGKNNLGIPREMAAIRTDEAQQACDVLRAKALFGGQVDGKTMTDGVHAKQFADMLLSTDPDIVFTHWGDDTHPDHRNVYTLTHDAWEKSGRKFMLVLYEVMTNIQTQKFQPNRFVDIGPALDDKRNAVLAHACQNPESFYQYHLGLQTKRGLEANVAHAEAFHVVSPYSNPLYRSVTGDRRAGVADRLTL